MIKFGTGGWRDVIGENFTFFNVRRFAQSVSDYIRDRHSQNKECIIGYDHRFMSEECAIAIAEVVAGNGVKAVIMSRAVPTPLVTYATMLRGAAAGLIVTASHNSAIYNGIKFVPEGGKPATLSITTELEKRMNVIQYKDVKRTAYEEAISAGMIARADFYHEYMELIEQQLDMDQLRTSRLRVLYDPMNGTGVTAMNMLLNDARCHYHMIHDNRDPLFGGRTPEPSKATLWRLSAMMQEGDYDIGIATDGDGDRLAIVDSEGEFIHPNEIMTILYYYLMEYRGMRGGVVRNVTTTHLLDRMAAAYGQRCMEKPVGFKHIAEGMQETDALIGGESSGGLTIRGHLLEKDGIMAAGLILEMLAVMKKPLQAIREEIVKAYGKLFFAECSVSLKSEQKDQLQQFLQKYAPSQIHQLSVVHIEKMDGIKFVLEDGSWLSCRLSGTEPLIRIAAESTDESITFELIKVIREIIEQI